MSTQCIGGSARKLVEARFLRMLAPKELRELELHLVACSDCSERYRRFQLAERVAAMGKERAHDEPSPLEIERIAADLDLIERPGKGLLSGWRVRLLSVGIPALAAVAVAGIAAVVFVPRVMISGGGELVERGASDGKTSARAYVISAGGEIHPLQNGASQQDFIKLRIEFDSEATSRATRSIEIAIPGQPRIRVDLPEGSERIRTVPGAVSLAKVGAGGRRVRVRGLGLGGEITFETSFELFLRFDPGDGPR